MAHCCEQRERERERDRERERERERERCRPTEGQSTVIPLHTAMWLAAVVRKRREKIQVSKVAETNHHTLLGPGETVVPQHPCTTPHVSPSPPLCFPWLFSTSFFLSLSCHISYHFPSLVSPLHLEQDVVSPLKGV